MTRRMSVSMTLDAVRAQTKTVTRRHVDTWRDLKAGDRLTLIEKVMGLPKGARQVVVAEVEIVSVRVETLRQVTPAEVVAEGLWNRAIAEGTGPLSDYCDDAEDIAVRWFRAFWAAGHTSLTSWRYWALGPGSPALLGQPCRRIEWRYLPPDVAEAVQR